MSLTGGTILTVIVGVAGVVVTLVGPLYYLILDIRRNGGMAEAERDGIVEDQKAIREDIKEIKGGLGSLRTGVQENAVRSEQNQQHIHQLLVGEHNAHDRDISNPHLRSDHCPLPDPCPWHSSPDAD